MKYRAVQIPRAAPCLQWTGPLRVNSMRHGSLCRFRRKFLATPKSNLKRDSSPRINLIYNDTLLFYDHVFFFLQNTTLSVTAVILLS